MQGNCSKPVPAAAALGLSTNDLGDAPLLQVLPGQCVLVVNSDFLEIAHTQSAWLEGLYIRTKDTADALGSSLPQALVSVKGLSEGADVEGWLYMKRVTLQVRFGAVVLHRDSLSAGKNVSGCFGCIPIPSLPGTLQMIRSFLAHKGAVPHEAHLVGCRTVGSVPRWTVDGRLLTRPGI